MIAYLIKCALVLIALFLARFFQWLPWSDLVNIGVTIVVPLLIAAGAWQTSKRHNAHTEREGADVALSAVERHLIRRQP
jgi:Co/Zn/Cd efflux system component